MSGALHKLGVREVVHLDFRVPEVDHLLGRGPVRRLEDVLPVAATAPPSSKKGGTNLVSGGLFLSLNCCPFIYQVANINGVVQITFYTGFKWQQKGEKKEVRPHTLVNYPSELVSTFTPMFGK